MAWSVRTVVVQASADSTLRTDQRPANQNQARRQAAYLQFALLPCSRPSRCRAFRGCRS